MTAPNVKTVRRRIVMVDDQADSREVFAEFLRMSGFAVDEYGAAKAALESIEAELPGVFLFDINLPGGIDGYEASRRIRQLPHGEEVRIVAMTGHSFATVRKEGPLFDAVLTKPIDPQQLVALVLGFFAG